ncbi:MAG: hypothetical protein ACSLE3_15750, partial [Microbacteriaceae bacterium]
MTVAQCLAEHQVEGVRQIFPAILREVIGQQKVHQVTDLDRFRTASVRHRRFFRLKGDGLQRPN